MNTTDSIAVKIVYWWLRSSKIWIIQAMDAEDNQVGDAAYAANRRTLPGEIAGLKSDHPNVKEVKQI